VFGWFRSGLGIRTHLSVASLFQHVDSAKTISHGLANPVQEAMQESCMIRRKIRLCDRASKLNVEILATSGTAARIG
jgi:hypothetical protein